MRFDTDFEELYAELLKELKGRPNWSQGFEPILKQYVFKLQAAEKVMDEINSEAVAVEHTNKAGHTNKATSPKWRMFLELTRSAAALAKDLQLNPATSPEKSKKKMKGLEAKMKVA